VSREKAFRGSLDGGYDIKLDGEPMKPLRTGTYFYADRPAGKHQMTCEAIMFPGATRFDFAAQPGRTYYYVVRPSGRADQLMGAQIGAGLVGYAVGAALTSDSANPGHRSIPGRGSRRPSGDERVATNGIARRGSGPENLGFGLRASVTRKAEMRALLLRECRLAGKVEGG